MRRAAFSVALLAASASALAGDAKSRFTVASMAVPGEVDEVVPADLDGDGKKDLVVTYATGIPPDQKRWLGIFWNQGGTFAAKPDLVIPADAETCAFDVGDVDGQPGDELLIVTPTGVVAHSLRGRQWGGGTPLVKEQTLFHQPGRDELPRLQVLQDIYAPDSRDLIVPGNGTLAVYRHAGAEFTPMGRFAIPLDTSLRERGYGGHAVGIPAEVERYYFPTIIVADSDGDGRKDILVALEDQLNIFRQGADGAFPEHPSLARNFRIRTAEELKERGNTAMISTSDIDGDGVADLIVRKQVAHGIASAVATTHVYFGRKGGTYPDKPDQVMKNQGVSGSEVELIDLTGDGHPDLVVPSVDIGIFTIIRYLTTSSVSVTFQVFPFDAQKRRFAEKPAAQRSLKFHVSLSGEADTQVIDERGDYNGDKRPDLVFGTEENELAIYPGVVGNELFAGDPIETIHARAYGEAISVDLDRKGKDDIVVYHPRTKDHRGEITVLVNHGPW